jgi:poly(beta-D-mannuronate) C5 epimerase
MIEIISSVILMVIVILSMGQTTTKISSGLQNNINPPSANITHSAPISSHEANMVPSSSSDRAAKSNSIGTRQDNISLINETILTSPTDPVLANAIANGISLPSYLTPKNTDLIIDSGNWTMKLLHDYFPAIIQPLPSEVLDKDNAYLIKKTIVVDKGAELIIVNNNVFLESSSKKDNIPTTILTYGKTRIFNSTVSSWDPQTAAPDPNPYHPRPFIAAKDGAKMDIMKSTITNMGFSQGGIHSLFSSIAGINYYNTSNFVIVNSTIAHNLYGFYSDSATNFKIIGNDIYDKTGYGLDPHSGSKDFIIDSNRIRFSGRQGIICSYQCRNVTITNNLVEYNMEGIGLHWLSNSSLIKNNIIKYNKNNGIFLKTHSIDNIVEDNTIVGNGYGIGLFDGSINNKIRSNILVGNILDQDGIRMDDDSQLNLVKDNRMSPSCHKPLSAMNICEKAPAQ